MLLWLQQNLGTIVVCLILLAVIGLSVGKIIRDRRKGKSTCGCGFAHCAMSGQCGKQ